MREIHIGAALVQPEQAALDGQIERTLYSASDTFQSRSIG
jgi:hypothetical protein